MVEKKRKKKRKKLRKDEPAIYQVPVNEVKPQPVSEPNKRSTLLDQEIISKIDQIYLEVRQKSGVEDSVTEKDMPIEKVKPESSYDETKNERRRIAKGRPSKEKSITVKELGYEYGIAAKDLRRMIRKAYIIRPGGRWEWRFKTKGLKKIKKLIAKSGKATKTPDREELK